MTLSNCNYKYDFNIYTKQKKQNISNILDFDYQQPVDAGDPINGKDGKHESLS